ARGFGVRRIRSIGPHRPRRIDAAGIRRPPGSAGATVTEGRWPARLLPLAASLVALWSLAPLAVAWDNAAPAYFTDPWEGWFWGSVVAALLLAVLLLLTRGRIEPMVAGLWQRLLRIPGPVFAAGAACL